MGLVGDSSDGEGLDGWSTAQRWTRTQRVVNQFSGDWGDENNDSRVFQYVFASLQCLDKADPRQIPQYCQIINIAGK